MEWFSVNDKTPKQGQQVLVIGCLDTELTERNEKIVASIGLVYWTNIDYSQCCDTCFYSMNYNRITHWSPVVLPAELEAEKEAGNA